MIEGFFSDNGFHAVRPEIFDDHFQVTVSEVEEAFRWDEMQRKARSIGPGKRLASTDEKGGTLYLPGQTRSVPIY